MVVQRVWMMEDKLKRYEKVEYLGEGQVIKNPYILLLLRQDMPWSSEIHLFYEMHVVASRLSSCSHYSSSVIIYFKYPNLLALWPCFSFTVCYCLQSKGCSKGYYSCSEEGKLCCFIFCDLSFLCSQYVDYKHHWCAWWIMHWKGFGRKQLWSKWDTVTAFGRKGGRKPKKKCVRVASYPVENRTKHPQITSTDCCLYIDLHDIDILLAIFVISVYSSMAFHMILKITFYWIRKWGLS